MRTILGAGHVVKIVALEDVSVLRTEPVLACPAVLQIAQTHTDLLIGPTVAQFWQTLLWLMAMAFTSSESSMENLTNKLSPQGLLCIWLSIGFPTRHPNFRWKQLDNAWYY